MSTLASPRPLGAVATGYAVLVSALGYFTTVFAAGVVLGIVRELWVAPAITSDLAVVAETPLMAVVVWLAARGAIRRLGEAGSKGAALFIGGVALAAVLGCEEVLSRALHGESIFAHWALYGYLAAAANLAGLAWLLLAPWAARVRPAR